MIKFNELIRDQCTLSNMYRKKFFEFSDYDGRVLKCYCPTIDC